MPSSSLRARPSLRPRHASAADRIEVRHVDALGGLDFIHASFTRPSVAHAHMDFELGVVSRGVRRVSCRGETTRVSRGTLVVFNPRDVHFGAPDDCHGSDYRALLIPGTAFPMAPAATDGRWFPSPIIHDVDLAARFTEIHEAIETRMSDADCEPALHDALRDLVHRHACDGLIEASGTRDTTGARLVRDHIERYYARPIPLDEMAAIAGLGVFRLIRAFREATGLPPHAYLEQVRVGRAVSMLRDGHPVSAVAYYTGFCDQSHMTRFFKRIVGVPPGRYRRSALRAAPQAT